MNPFEYFQDTFKAAVTVCVSSHGWPESAVNLVRGEPPRDVTHGDIALSVPLEIAREAGRKPMELADELATILRKDNPFSDVTIHKPGFVNLHLHDKSWQSTLRTIIAAGPTFGHQTFNNDRSVNVEFVSANPTGPLTLANARGAIVGDVLASLLAATGCLVQREYYINDSGSQIDRLAEGLWHRMREIMTDNPGPFPEKSYPGAYLKDVAQTLVNDKTTAWRDMPPEKRHAILRREGVALIMKLIHQDLADLAVVMDHFSSEAAFVKTNSVISALDYLKRNNFTYEGFLPAPKVHNDDTWKPRKQLLFRSSDYGDDQDRPLQKPDGSWTYFAVDISYHLDKIKRLPKRPRRSLIDVVGADHSGYISRIGSAVRAFSHESVDFIPIVTQIVRLIDNGQIKKMSKRAGTMVPVSEFLQKVPGDALRFHMLMRSADAPLDIDVAEWERESKDNPVYYIHYAHARICSLRRRAGDDLWTEALNQAEWPGLKQPWEYHLLHSVAQWPRTIALAAQAYEPHRIGIYLHRLAAQYHQTWARARQDTDARFIISDNKASTLARLALSECVRCVLVSGLGIIGVTPREELSRIDE